MIGLPRTVLILSLVSFLNDTASEMITPLLPLFLTASLGAGPAIVGLVEGVAEATASLLKLVSGRLADRGWNPKGLVLGGYSISNLSRPLIGIALAWGWVLSLRFLDRVGKGLRTSPRDALIAASTTEATRGKAFGFHRALDNAGAMVGPLIAYWLLQQGESMEQVFLASVIPGVLVIGLLVWGLKRPPPIVPSAASQKLSGWSGLDTRVRALIIAAGGLALASAPEVFLILWASDRGLAVVWVPLVWAAASAVKAIIAVPAGMLSDRFGRVPVLAIGWSLRIVLLVLLAATSGGSGTWTTWAVFLAYAGALAATEGAERALIGDRTPEQVRGTAFGLYHMIVGLAALPGAVLFGTIWQTFSTASAFALAAAIGAASMLILLLGARTRAETI